ncbi:hypothetical protein CLOP_g18147 [Closterium sp. NIES-67]|nr:hypothetical protein CLOP_g18147 [Closterium sp. NIES-67]
MPLETSLDVVHATSPTRASVRPAVKAPRGRWQVAFKLWRVIAALPRAVSSVAQRVRGGMASGKARRALMRRVMRQMVAVHEEEMEVVLEAFCSFFFLLAAYFVCQPLRDEAAMSLGTGALPGLFLASLASTVAAAPLSSALLSRTDISKGRALLLLYRFFSLCLLGFFCLYLLVPPPAVLPALPKLPDALVEEATHAVHAAVLPYPAAHSDAAGQLAVFADVSLPFLAVRAGLFLFVALLNLFAIAAMWARLADVMTSEAGARLFGFIGAGATFGQLAGSLLASSLAALGPYLLILSAVLMEVAARCSTLIDDGCALPHAAHARGDDAHACAHGEVQGEGHRHGWCSHARPRKCTCVQNRTVAPPATSPLRPCASIPMLLSSSSPHSSSLSAYCTHQPRYPPATITTAPTPSPPLLTPADTPSHALLTPPAPTDTDPFPSPFLPLPPPAQPSPLPPSAPCLLHARVGEEDGTGEGERGGLGACGLHERGRVGGGEEGSEGGDVGHIAHACATLDHATTVESSELSSGGAREGVAGELVGVAGRRVGAVLRSAVSWPQSMAEAAAAEGRGEESARSKDGGRGLGGRRAARKGVGRSIGGEGIVMVEGVAGDAQVTMGTVKEMSGTVAGGAGAAGAFRAERGELVCRRRSERVGGLGRGEEKGMLERHGGGESGNGHFSGAVSGSTSGAAVSAIVDAGVSVGIVVQQKHLKGHLAGDMGVQVGGDVDHGEGSGEGSAVAGGTGGQGGPGGAAGMDLGNSPSKLKPRPLWQWQWLRLQAPWHVTGRQEREEQGWRGARPVEAERGVGLAGDESNSDVEQRGALLGCHAPACRVAGQADAVRGGERVCVQGGAAAERDAAACISCRRGVDSCACAPALAPVAEGQEGATEEGGLAEVLQGGEREESVGGASQGWVAHGKGQGSEGVLRDPVNGLPCTHFHLQRHVNPPAAAAAPCCAGSEAGSVNHAGTMCAPCCCSSSRGGRSSRGGWQGGGLRDLVAGVRLVLSSSYLLHVCAFLMLTAIVSSFFYFERSSVVATSVVDPVQRRKAIANINSLSAVATVVFQLTLTGRLLTTFGVAAALAASPVAALIGMAAIAWHPTPLVVAGSEALRKVVTYVLTRPSREILFTVVTREEKYKAKVTIDTVVQRLGDAAAAGFFRLLGGVFLLGPSGVATYTVPLCVLWCGLAVTLGLRQQAMARMQQGGGPAPKRAQGF